MRVLEREVGSSSAPLRNAQRISRPALWLLTPCVSLASAFLYMDFSSEWTLYRALFFTALALLSLCLGLSLVSQRRFWWAPRLIAALICLGFLVGVYLAATLPFSGNAERFPPLFMATLAYLVWGVPALCFVLWGHTGAKLARGDTVRITRMDRWTNRLLMLLYYAVVIAVCFYVAHQIYLDIAPLPR